jgi:hypothetical protein
MEATPSKAALPAVTNAEVLEGRGYVWGDGWASAQLEFKCRAKSAVEAIELVAWNPDWSAVSAGNVITLRVDDVEVSTSPLAMGERFQLRANAKIAAGAVFRIVVQSAAARMPDPLDARERAFVLNSLAAISPK